MVLVIIGVAVVALWGLSQARERPSSGDSAATNAIANMPTYPGGTIGRAGAVGTISTTLRPDQPLTLLPRATTLSSWQARPPVVQAPSPVQVTPGGSAGVAAAAASSGATAAAGTARAPALTRYTTNPTRPY
jgi:hypothetical protein